VSARPNGLPVPADSILLSVEAVHDLAFRVLVRAGMSDAHAMAVAKVIAAGQRDECNSHGLYRLLVTTHTLRQGRVSGTALPVLTEPSASIVVANAQFAFSLLAFEQGSKLLVDKARNTGIAALAIRNCFHFSALWPEVEVLADQGLAAIAMSPSHAWVAPAGGDRPVFGTNPFAFGWPRRANPPYVFDFATSEVARGDIELHRRAGDPVPLGWGLDSGGSPTTNAAAILDEGAMLTFGGHKGSAISTMIELLAGPLIGDLTSLDSLELDSGVGGTPCHGELIIAFDPARFGFHDTPDADARAERLFAAITDQGARLPSQRRYAARQRSLVHGVRVPTALHREILELLR
jgi:LDH2 family malate/lactate/ureidoglycolate dehydrogenase